MASGGDLEPGDAVECVVCGDITVYQTELPADQQICDLCQVDLEDLIAEGGDDDL